MGNRKRIAVIFGGNSPEYEVSLASASAVISGMDRNRYEPVLIGITRDGRWYRFEGDIYDIENDTWHEGEDCMLLAVVPGAPGCFLAGNGERIYADAAFPVLHGRNGEDGTVQGLLETAGIPVIGCGVLSSALCMDKYRAHMLAGEEGIDVPVTCLADENTGTDELLSMGEGTGYPLFVKPLRAGSSFGITKVTEAEGLTGALKKALEYDDKAVIEEAVDGFEVGCAVIGTETLITGVPDEIELSDGFFDYTEKYTLKTSAIHVPARVDDAVSERIIETACRIYRVLGCSGFARVDMFLTEEGRIVFNEVNTIPGFTEHSRFPNMLKAAGMTFEDIISTLIDNAPEVKR